MGGLPLFQNDDVIIPSVMKELGFTLRDARDYALIGCQEITGSGNDYAGGNGTTPPEAYTQYSTILDMALNDGVNPMNGVQAPIHTGYLYDMTSLDEVKEAWKKLARYVLKAQVSIENFVEYLFMHYDQYPILSITMEGCMESGRDIVCGGAKYNSFGSTAVGLATVADSLTTIRYMCFDKKLITTRELYDAWMGWWTPTGSCAPSAPASAAASSRGACTPPPATWPRATPPGQPPTAARRANPLPTLPPPPRGGTAAAPPACSPPPSALSMAAS